MLTLGNPYSTGPMRVCDSTGPMRVCDSTGDMGHAKSITRSCARTTFETTQLPHELVAPGEGRHYDAFSRMGGEPKDRRMHRGQGVVSCTSSDSGAVRDRMVPAQKGRCEASLARARRAGAPRVASLDPGQLAPTNYLFRAAESLAACELRSWRAPVSALAISPAEIPESRASSWRAKPFLNLRLRSCFPFIFSPFSPFSEGRSRRTSPSNSPGPLALVCLVPWRRVSCGVPIIPVVPLFSLG